jgi:hypothetical protein
MNFLEKNALYNRLKKSNDPVKDRELLVARDPECPVLKTKFFDKTREANSILDALLNVASADDILANRMGMKVASKAKPGSKKKENVKKKSKRK